MVEFCEDCGALIMGKKGQEVECPSCGKVKKAKKDVKISKKLDVKEDLEVIDKDAQEEVNPITDEENCPECGHGRAYYWTKKMRAGDEPEVNFYKCEKCKHQWRIY